MSKPLGYFISCGGIVTEIGDDLAKAMLEAYEWADDSNCPADVYWRDEDGEECRVCKVVV